MVTSSPRSLDAAHTAVCRRELFGIQVAALTLEEALDRVELAVETRTPLRIAVVNAAKVVGMRLSCDPILADGISVVWASRLLGLPLPERVAGIDLMNAILTRGQSRGYRVYCLGATQEVLEKATARIVADHPGISLVGFRNGYYGPDEEATVAREIAAARPDVLLVAMASPRKEGFLARWSDRLGVPVCHGVGDSFDVLAGKVQRAPQMWQQFGLEWLYRLKQEPGRLWRRYLVTNTLFLGMFLLELVRTLPRRLRALPRPGRSGLVSGR